MAKEIADITLSRANNGAHFRFITTVVEQAKADEKIYAKCKKCVDALETALADEDRNLKLSMKSFLTDRIAKADTTRGKYYLHYKSGVYTYEDYPDEKTAMASKILIQHIKDYGINPRMQLDRETGLLLNFIADLETKYAEHIKLLGLERVVEQLRIANDLVHRLMIDRTTEWSGRTVGALKKSREKCDDLYRVFSKRVNAMAMLEEVEDYDPFIDFLNTEIVRFKRESMGAKVNPDDTPDDGSDDSGSDGGDSGGEVPDIPGGV